MLSVLIIIVLIKQVTLNKCSLLLKNILQNIQTVQLNENENYLQK